MISNFKREHTVEDEMWRSREGQVGMLVEARSWWIERVEYHKQVEVSRWSEEVGGEE